MQGFHVHGCDTESTPDYNHESLTHAMGSPPPRRVFKETQKPQNNRFHCTSHSTLFRTGKRNMHHALCCVRRPDGSFGMALVLPALTDCRWRFESLLVHSGVSSATRRKATGADHKKKHALCCVALVSALPSWQW